MKFRKQILLLFSAAFLAAPASGFNLKFLDDAAISEFKEKDIDMMIQTLEEAMENADDGAVIKWTNPKTGNHGSVSPLNRKTHQGYQCREADIKNYSGTFSGRTIRLMCKAEDGSWKVVPTS